MFIVPDQEHCQYKQQTILVVTPFPDFTRLSNRIIQMEDGRIVA